MYDRSYTSNFLQSEDIEFVEWVVNPPQKKISPVHTYYLLQLDMYLPPQCLYKIKTKSVSIQYSTYIGENTTAKFSLTWIMYNFKAYIFKANNWQVELKQFMLMWIMYNLKAKKRLTWIMYNSLCSAWIMYSFKANHRYIFKANNWQVELKQLWSCGLCTILRRNIISRGLCTICKAKREREREESERDKEIEQRVCERERE